MPREKELYRDTLDRFRQVADQKRPGKLLFKQGEMAELLEVSPQTLARKGLTGDFITLEQAARTFA